MFLMFAINCFFHLPPRGKAADFGPFFFFFFSCFLFGNLVYRDYIGISQGLVLRTARQSLLWRCGGASTALEKNSIEEIVDRSDDNNPKVSATPCPTCQLDPRYGNLVLLAFCKFYNAFFFFLVST